jgi:hypothetical protein
MLAEPVDDYATMKAWLETRSKQRGAIYRSATYMITITYVGNCWYTVECPLYNSVKRVHGRWRVDRMIVASIHAVDR